MCNTNIVKIVLEVEDLHHCNTVAGIFRVVWDREIDVFLLTVKWEKKIIKLFLMWTKINDITLKDERVKSNSSSSMIL